MKAERVAGSKRLIVLQIDLGNMTRQSVAGLGEQYDPDALVSKLVAVVTNLKPRKVFGLDSEVMLLAAVDGPAISILQPDKAVTTGAKVM